MTPRSTADVTFLNEVQQCFMKNQRTLVVIRYAYGGGSKDFVLLDNFDQFVHLLENLRHRDSVIVVESYEEVMEGTVDSGFIDDALSRCQEGTLWILIGPDNYEYTADWAYADSAEELKEELEARIGNKATIVPEPDYISEQGTIDAYVPDADGIVRPGAY